MSRSRFTEEQIIAILGVQEAEGPLQNGQVESFDGRLRDECPNETLFASLSNTRSVLGNWRDDDNPVRPPSGIGGLAPAEAARRVVQPARKDTMSNLDSTNEWRSKGQHV